MVRVIESIDKRIPVEAVLLSINDQSIDDLLEYQFYNDITKARKVLVEYNSTREEILFRRDEEIGIKLADPEYRHCENNCDFCFINGLPRGLRKELYFKDDDYRLSFLFGNFLSLTNVTQDDIKRIARLKLTPLYISVHTTNLDLRKRIFKNDRAELIMEQLTSLVDNNITLHCQVVIIPGLTDGKELVKTIKNLSMLYPGVQSIGVVPAGVTKYTRNIAIVSKKIAVKTVQIIEELHKGFRRKYKKGLVYCSDELYIKACLPIPDSDYYDNSPQYENGIGMVRSFLNEIENLGRIKKLNGKILLLTGRLAFPLLNFLKLKLGNRNIDVSAINNLFFGNSVTVSGLIAGEDFQRTINRFDKNYDKIILPPNCVNDSGEFIDRKVIDDRRVMIAPNSIKELIECLQ